MFMHDPLGFLARLLERLRLSSPGVSKFLTPIFGRFSGSTAGKVGGLSQIAPLGPVYIQPSPTPPAPTTALRPTRVLFYINNCRPFTKSGYTERTHEMLTSLKNTGVEVLAVTRFGYPLVVGRFPRQETQYVDGVRYDFHLPLWYRSSARKRVREDQKFLERIIEEFEPDILHTTTPHVNAVVVSKVAASKNIPWVYEVRGEPEQTWLVTADPHGIGNASLSYEYSTARRNETKAMKSAARTIVLSDVSKEEMVRRGVAREQMVVIRNAVLDTAGPLRTDPLTLRKELGLPGNISIIGTISSLVEYEGIDDLIRATVALPQCILVIVGEGRARPALENLVDELGLRHQVIFTGHQDPANTAKWYQTLDVFVVPRKDLPVCRTVTPTKTLKAQLSFTPVVAANLPALREITGERAYYFESGDVEGLVDAIRRAIDNGPIDGAATWAKRNNWAENARKIVSLYDEILGP